MLELNVRPGDLLLMALLVMSVFNSSGSPLEDVTLRADSLASLRPP